MMATKSVRWPTQIAPTRLASSLKRAAASGCQGRCSPSRTNAGCWSQVIPSTPPARRRHNRKNVNWTKPAQRASRRATPPLSPWVTKARGNTTLADPVMATPALAVPELIQGSADMNDSHQHRNASKDTHTDREEQIYRPDANIDDQKHSGKKPGVDMSRDMTPIRGAQIVREKSSQKQNINDKANQARSSRRKG